MWGWHFIYSFLLSRNLELTWHMWALLPLFQHEATTGDTTWQKKWFVGKSYTAKSRGARIGVRLVNWISAIILLDIGKKKYFWSFSHFTHVTFYTAIYGSIGLIIQIQKHMNGVKMSMSRESKFFVLTKSLETHNFSLINSVFCPFFVVIDSSTVSCEWGSEFFNWKFGAVARL